MAGSKKPVSRGEFLAVASDVAWNLRAYDPYGKRPAQAIRALKKRCPGFSDTQYRNAFKKSVALYDAVQGLLRTHNDRIWAAYRAKQAYENVFNEELSSQFPGFRKSTLGSMVGMSFFYWHLR